MKLSSNNIHFSQNKLKEMLTISNSTNNRVIYKLKVNNTEAFYIYPGKGFIAPLQTLEIQISLRKYADIKGKLLLIYAQVDESPQSNFDKIWSSVQKQAFINEMIEILCAPILPKAIKSQNYLKRTESPVYEPELQGSNHYRSEKSNESNVEKKQMMQSVVFVHKTTTNISKISKNIRSSKQEEQNQMKDSRKIDKTKTYEHQLKKQRERARKLKENLLQKQKTLRYYQQLAQKDINNSIQPEQQQFKLNNLNLCLLIVVCILFGFFVAKINLNSTDSTDI